MTSALRLAAGTLKELRIHFCQKSFASSGVREFMENDYVNLKKNNIHFPILIRECSGISPKIWARYDYGAEVSVSVENVSREKIIDVIKGLAAK